MKSDAGDLSVYYNVWMVSASKCKLTVKNTKKKEHLGHMWDSFERWLEGLDEINKL